MRIHLLLLIAPLILSNIAHMMVVKQDLFPQLKIPLSRSLFGENKTWRGFVFLSIFNALSVGLFSLFFANTFFEGFCYGAVLGFTYMLFELPNSLLKRTIGIAPGGKPKKFVWFFALLDKMDSSFGVCLVYAVIMDLSFSVFCLLFLASVFLHSFFSLLLFQLNVKNSF